MHKDRLQGLDVPELDGPAHYHNSYEELISRYTRRKMTYPSDKLNAIEGIMNIVRLEHNVDFLCGMPTSHLFGRWLCWVPAGPSVSSSSGGQESTKFPTWSWAGWHGEATYPEQSIPREWTSPHKFDHEGIHVDLLSEVQDWQMIGPDLSVLPQHTTLHCNFCMLRFDAETADFLVSDDRYGIPYSMHEVRKSSVCKQILYSNIRVGAMIAHSSKEPPVYEHERETGTAMRTFVALSRTRDRWSMYYPVVPDPVSSNSNQQAWETNRFYAPADFDPAKEDLHEFPHPPYDLEHYEHNGSVVNVLMIEEKDGIAYRTGIGQIHADAWDAAEPVEHNILLA
ncbi:hypothetical protein LTR62_003811 [Meristemomyces frigidus]|uniref:Uncharacterized protein n=1 Tax=Meristemomyces frigidus TaxID=1508187 RepID=A0AAN7TI80_9PEZI|nr:hypothetical protein LTR62_003811 [Meristemomyces frigidus]